MPDNTLLAAIAKAKQQDKMSLAKKRLHYRVTKQLWGLPSPEAEVLFHPTRKWRFDYAWPDQKIALEVHGATHNNGRHTRGKGYANDREKMNEAQLLGWIVIEVASENIPDVRAWIQRAMELRYCKE